MRGAPSARRGGSLERDAPLFLVLYILVLASIAVYRVRAFPLAASVAPGIASDGGFGAYLGAAAASDALAASLALVVLAFIWLLSALIGRAFAFLSILLVAVFAFLMTAGVDFMRVYQTAFSKSFVGGEHFTGIREMLLSASAEFSAASKAVAAALIAVIGAASALALGARAAAIAPASLRAGRLASIIAAATLAFMIATGAARPAGGYRPGAEAASASPAGLVSAAPAGTAAEQGAPPSELGINPLSALVFGPGRETFMPVSIPAAAPAYYDTDSLEKPGVDRRLPAVAKLRRNVILYFFESTSWRYYDLVEGGRPVMPAMRALASRGLLLENHYSNYPLSANTLYTVLSSRYSMYGKSMIFHDYYDVDVRTLPEVLHDAGYATCFVHTGDLLYASRNKFLADRDIDTILLQKDLQRDGRYRANVGWGADERAMIDPAVEWIKAQDRPFFLMMSPVNPHHPYAIPGDFERLVDPGEPGIDERERTWRNYLNSLHYADASLGLLVEALERERLMDDTVLVVVTDHGEAFRQHPGNYNHPLFIYEENVHVPALFYGPGAIPEGVKMESVTRHVDIMPSILDLIGVEDEGRRDGESIFSRSREKMAVFHTSWVDELMGVRDGKWKYIKRMKDSREELYDLDADPWETRNIASEFPDQVLRYRGTADEMVAYMIDQYRDVARIPGYALD